MAEENEDQLPDMPALVVPIDIAAVMEENGNLKEALAALIVHSPDGRLTLPAEYTLPEVYALRGEPDERTGQFVLTLITDAAELERLRAQYVESNSGGEVAP